LKAISLVDEPDNAQDGIAAIDAQDHGPHFEDGLPRNDDDEQKLESLDVVLERQSDFEDPSHPVNNPASDSGPESESSDGIQASLYDDPSESDDGEGEWITPSNVALHKSRALQLLPNDGAKSKKADEVIHVGCMTADFAVQNVLLHMGLNLISVDGKRIQKLKTWVLRCHACFKCAILLLLIRTLTHFSRICKDSSKKFCPSCGNPTLLRTSVTIAAPGVSGQSPVMQVHLKKNFQYRTRGTIYSIPDPKPGSAKTGPGEGLILREDQLEYVRAKKRADAKKGREEQKMMKGIFGEHGVGVGSWMDPDWVPEMISVGSGGKGRKIRGATDSDMPTIGHGRKNPNERRRK
jgi:RNA-binding protein NOB1